MFTFQFLDAFKKFNIFELRNFANVIGLGVVFPCILAYMIYNDEDVRGFRNLCTEEPIPEKDKRANYL